MKLVAKQLTTIFNSLKATVELVERESWPLIRGAGFASLPDELLARIFEMCMPARPEGPANHYCFSQKLASVCRRFRHIALRLPRLWEDVGNFDDIGHIRNSKERCRNPCVFVGYWDENQETLEEFIHLLHPANQWKHLIVQSEEDDTSRVVDVLTSTTRGDFRSLESLSLQLNWEDEEYDIEEDVGVPHTNLSDSDAALLSTWKLPALRDLAIRNFIPRGITCPNLRHCDIDLSRYTQTFSWDINALKNFLRSVHLIESLSFTFNCANSPAGYGNHDAGGSSNLNVKFPRLMSLVIHVGHQTQAKFLADIMDAIDTPVLTTLKVFMDDIDGTNFELEATSYHAWLCAIFTSSSSSSARTPRVFATVTTLDLHVPLDNERPQNDVVYPAVPRVQHLRLKVPPSPTTSGRRARDIFKRCDFRCWENLRTIHIGCTPSNDALWCMFVALRGMLAQKKLEKLEEIKLAGLSGISYCKEKIKELLGDKLVQ